MSRQPLSETHEIKFAAVNATATGDNAVVTAVSGKKIVVMSYVLSAAADVVAKWQTGDVDRTGPGLALAENGGAIAAFNPHGWFAGAVGEDLDLNLSGTVNVGGHISYCEV